MMPASTADAGNVNTNMLNFSQQQYKQKTDEQLLSAYADGEQKAFEILYRRHCDALYRFLLRQCNQQTELCDEVFQDVWMNIVRKRHQFRGEARFSNYLYQVARNKVIDHARLAISHHASQHDTDSDSLQANSNQQPESQSQLAICIELLQQMILQLPAEQREVFVLKQETEHNLEELADILQTSFETIKSRLRYAMNKLREWLPRDCL